ncbi:PREDICTED: probable G-protein coupled receptor AH9.1 [Priapulus caudatus]|uniref:Probable G-protein coupled receptor AH9.1 n=1 Tax=Priapulus caudatus TaxID=37621 RepID=A0ABM1DYM2_PRICU|nr:PREDICTED: probable G-protein coupled receptor AH9.1 [Priapulus caudatus]
MVRSRLLKQTKWVMWYYSHVCFYLFRSLMCISNLLIVALTVDRYLHVVHAQWRHVDELRRRATLTTAIITVFSFVLHIPHTIETTVEEFLSPDTYEVYYNWHWTSRVQDLTFYRYVYPVIKEIFNRFIPIVCVLTLNPLILRAHRDLLVRRRDVTSSATQRKLASEERRLTVLLVSASAVFLLCTLPQAFVTIVLRAHQHLYPDNQAFYTYVHVANVIEALNFSVDFYVYSVASSDFRRSFGDVICACSRRRDARRDPSIDGVSDRALNKR